MKRKSHLLDDFEILVENFNLQDEDSDEGLFENNTKEIRHLASVLQLTEVQVCTLVAFFAKMFDGMTLEKIGEALEWSPVQLLKNENQIDDLVKRNYLRRERNYRQVDEYRMTSAAREAIRNNKPLENVAAKKDEYFIKMPLIERFEVVGDYLRQIEDSRDDEPVPEIEDMPENVRKQIANIETALGWTDKEVIVFAKVMQAGGHHHRSRNRLFSSYQDRNRFKQAADALRKKRFIFSLEQYSDDDFRVMPLVLTQLENGEDLCFSLKFADNDALFEGLRIQFRIRKGDLHYVGGRIYKEMAEDITQIIENNQHLTICRELAGLSLERKEIVTLVYLCHRLVSHNDDEVKCNLVEDILDEDAAAMKRYVQNLRSGKTTLHDDGWVEPTGNSLFDGETIGLTRKARNTLLSDIKLVKSNVVNAKELKKPDTFVEKRMYYNERERTEVERLAKLLKPDHFKGVKERLKVTGERTGFVCLFYGAPGTGKTETVQQIARQTGRALYQINISEINSKWVGESEKNIKRVFDRYREFAEYCPVEPILFFNEADGVFTKRLDTAGSSNPVVTQMQNAVQNIVLQEMETLDGIMIATTNLTQNLDPAMERRILYKVKFDKPETAVKAQIWQSFIPALTDEQAKTLAIRYDFSGGQIENVKRKSVVDNILTGKEADFDQINDYCSREKLNNGRMRIGFCG